MSVSRRIFYNTLAQTLGKTFAAIIGIITIALLSRYLAENGFGQYSTVVAFLGVFGIMADLGLYLFVVREISKADTDHPKIISNALGLRLVVTLGALILGALIALALPYNEVVKKVMFLGIGAFLFVSLNQVLVGIFQKHLVQHLVVASETIGRAVNLLLIYLFIRGGLSLPFFILALVAGNGVNFLFTVLFARRYERFGIAFDIAEWKKILAVAWPLVFAVFLNLLYFKTDTVILSLFWPQETVGVYSLPYKILEGVLAFPAMFVGLIMPLLSKSAFITWDAFKKVWQYAFDALLLMAILIIATFVFFAQDIVNLFRGNQPYLDSPALLQILILAAAIIFLGTLMGYAVVAVNRQKTMIKGYLLGAVTGLILYFALIPKYSYWGAAWGTVITEAVVAGFAYFLVRQESSRTLSLKILGPALPAIMVLVLFFKFVSIQWVLEIIIGSALYIACLIWFGAIPKQFIRELAFKKE